MFWNENNLGDEWQKLKIWHAEVTKCRQNRLLTSIQVYDIEKDVTTKPIVGEKIMLL